MNSTPYLSDEINNEIYPKENFIISPQLNLKHQLKFDKINESNLDNFSVCSTEISFSINSEYENINQLSDNNYSKDKIFRTKINNFIKDETKKKKNGFKINIISDNNDSNIQKKRTFCSKTNSIKSSSINHVKSQKNNRYLLVSNKDLSNRKLLKDEKDENKDDILSLISQNIEQDNMNLNNPNLFYSGIFMKFMDDKVKENDPNEKITKEEVEFIRRMSSIKSNK